MHIEPFISLEYSISIAPFFSFSFIGFHGSLLRFRFFSGRICYIWLSWLDLTDWLIEWLFGCHNDCDLNMHGYLAFFSYRCQNCTWYSYCYFFVIIHILSTSIGFHSFLVMIKLSNPKIYDDGWLCIISIENWKLCFLFCCSRSKNKPYPVYLIFGFFLFFIYTSSIIHFLFFLRWHIIDWWHCCWTLIPLLVVLAIIWYSFVVFIDFFC